ncbi:MAG TPA: glycoside hydrolase family 16 protein [Streptosporangiaceae bacterium]|nr:glycoside hydrolase family 16 protein [Streptosporangiaceae bacterium]
MRFTSTRRPKHSHRGGPAAAAAPPGAPVPAPGPADCYAEPGGWAGPGGYDAEPADYYAGPGGYDPGPGGYDAGPAGHDDLPEPVAHRRRKAWLLVFVLPVTALLVAAVTLTGLHVTGGGTIHVTADTGQQAPRQRSITPLDTSPSCCVSSAISSAAPGTPTPPSHRHHAGTAKKSGSSSTTKTGNTTEAPGSMPGWRLVYTTDFPGNSLPSGWDAYTGQPGGDPYGSWNPANVSVGGGALHLLATSSGQAGVAYYGNPQTYGMYLVRMKGDYEPGLSINNLAILWPSANGVWPPEVDFFQDLGGSRQSFSASLHAGPDGNGGCCVIASPTQDNNGTQWHTYGVEWTPTAITYTVDGRPWGSVQRSSLAPPAQWPTIPMNLTLQSQNQASAQPNGQTETMTVAWVAEYAMNG